ncbi:cysteine proteinase [Melanomma pulvis-pyrius CBS 109.77]|uniref:Cysteine proteinase n=1 Tax=Melanomma pulvis-pyrius CBS 109.77 TaxID=1314802 RepID=A0A6A6XCU4_9PLEO|nr:cysteine proteinase [Melanomma pulvis-pyrius CBS 109.77]
MAAPPPARVFGLRSGNRTAATPRRRQLIAGTTRTPAQIQKDRHAVKISNKWPIPRTRRIKESRGIHRDGNSCYQLASLQALLHLRKFMNWILTHNVQMDEGIQNPCDDGALLAYSCVACLIKRLIFKYWGLHKLDTAGHPVALPTHDMDMKAMEAVADHWYLPEGSGMIRGQQDGEDFQFKVLEACILSTDCHRELDKRIPRLVQTRETWVCRRCDHPIPNPRTYLNMHPDPELGFLAMRILRTGRETIEDVIERKLADEPCIVTAACPHCNQENPPKTRQYCIEAAPEILRIALAVGSHDSAGNVLKERNPVQFEQTLDLTNFQHDQNTPLRYRLSSVTLHQCETLHVGHWVSTVQGYGKKVFAINNH